MAELFRHAGTQVDPQMVQDFASLTSLDQKKLHGRVMQRWLQQLDPAASNASCQLGEASTAIPLKQSNVDALFYEKLLENMHDGVIFVDSRMAILLWNRGAERLTDIISSSVY